jgi:hypothetical protein
LKLCLYRTKSAVPPGVIVPKGLRDRQKTEMVLHGQPPGGRDYGLALVGT